MQYLPVLWITGFPVNWIDDMIPLLYPSIFSQKGIPNLYTVV